MRTFSADDVPSFATLDVPAGSTGGDAATWEAVGKAGEISSAPLIYPITDFYLTNPIARASRTMAECSRLFVAAPAVQAAE